MAIHTNLPIYKVAYDLLDLSTELVKNMRRDLKHVFGSKVTAECIEILVLIGRANAARDKAPILLELLERVQVAEFLIRLAHDKKLISTKLYARSVELTTSVGRQANGWRGSSK
jgi:hypothetical protein